MKFYLSSYKLGDKEGELKKWIDVNGNKIALIPNSRDIYEDGERKMSGINKDSEQLKEIGFDVSIISLKDYFGKYLVFGIMVLFTTQALANMFVVTGVVPSTGVTLPLISYGGSSTIIIMTALGIVINVINNIDDEVSENE